MHGGRIAFLREVANPTQPGKCLSSWLSRRVKSKSPRRCLNIQALERQGEQLRLWVWIISLR